MIKNYFPIEIIKKLDKDNNTKVIIIEGAGKGFSAGHNLKEVQGLNKKQKYPEDFSFHYEVIRKIKNYFGKDIVLLIDTCLCSITVDGHCGVTHKKSIDLNKTHYSLGLAANTYLEAGADIIAPSDMMKNTTKYLRKIFVQNGFSNSQIMSYSTKFKSHFYGPFRDVAK